MLGFRIYIFKLTLLGYLFGFLSIGEDVNLLANVQLTALNLLDSYPYPPFFFF